MENVSKNLAMILNFLSIILVYISLKKEQLSHIINDYTFYGILAASILFWTILFRSSIIYLFYNISLRIGLSVIIKHQKSHLEFIDKYGKEVMYYEETQFKRIKRRKQHSAKLEIDGIISEYVDTFNCHYSLNNKRDAVEIIFGNYERKGENNIKLLHQGQRFFSYALTMNDSFKKKKESWQIHCRHYIKAYDLDLSFPLENPPKNAKITEIIKDKKSKKGEIEVDVPINPIIIKRNSRIIMKIKLLELKRGRKFKVTWEWSQEKK